MYIRYEINGFEWDPTKAATNLAKHGVDFADAALSLGDPKAVTIADPDSVAEERFVTIGADPQGAVLVVVYSHIGDNQRIISARKASRGERKRYEEGYA